MASVYRKLFSIGITHTYYTNGVGNADFAIRPTHDTIQRLRMHRMRFLANDSGVHVLYESNFNVGLGQYEPFIPAAEMADDLQLGFVMELANPWFFNITNLQPSPDKELRRMLFYYDSALATPTLAGTVPDYTSKLAFGEPEELDFKNAAFSHLYTLAGNPLQGSLRVVNSAGTTLQTYTSVRDENNNYTAFVELSRLKPGRYGLQKVNGAVVEGAISYFYYDPGINPAATFGLLEVKKDDTWAAIQAYNADPGRTAAMALDLPFAYREVPWTYKVVFKKSDIPDFEDIAIEETFVVVDGNRYHSLEAEDKFYFKVVEVVDEFDGNDMLVFKSVDGGGDPKDYPLLQETKKNLSLKIGEDTIYADLPNLDYKSLKNEVIIYV